MTPDWSEGIAPMERQPSTPAKAQNAIIDIDLGSEVDSQQEPSILQLQRTVGNQAVGQVLQQSQRSGGDRLFGLRAAALAQQRTHGNRFVQEFIQAKLEVSQPGDPFEREADAVADRIVSAPPVDNSGAIPGEVQDPDSLQNGVLPHAEHAVSAASSSVGHPLPSNLQAKFERALGADLSAVRVHTGSESIEANRAVSARAYTNNNDIHFNQGQYDPDSRDGQHLLAHEITHTIQQGGGMRRWSTVGTSPAVHRSGNVVQRGKAEDLTEMAEAGEAAAVADQKANVNQPPVGRVSNIGDVAAARTLVAQIEGWRANMQEGAQAQGAFTVSAGRVTPEKMAANEQAISALDDYLVTAGEQSRTLGSFQDGLGKARTDYERLKAQVTHLVVTNQVAGGTSGDIGQQIVQNAGFADPAAAEDRMKKLELNPGLLAVKNQVQEGHEKMVALGQAAGDKQGKVSQAAYGYQSALNNFKTGIPSIKDNPDQAKELAELNAKIETVKKYVGKGLEYAGKALDKVVPGAEKVGEHAAIVTDWLTDQFYDAQLNGIQSTIAQYNAAHSEHAITAKLDDIRAASGKFTTAVTAFQNAVEAFAHAQSTFRETLRSFGRSADAGHGDRFAQIASVLAEVDTYENQVDETLRLAYQEQTAAHEATAARRTAVGGPTDGGGRQAGMPYYEPYKFFHSNGGWGYECTKNELNLGVLPSSRGSAEGVENVGVNATVDKAVLDLQGYRKEVDPMRKALAQAMNLNMDSSIPVAPGAPAPTSKSANTGL